MNLNIHHSLEKWLAEIRNHLLCFTVGPAGKFNLLRSGEPRLWIKSSTQLWIHNLLCLQHIYYILAAACTSHEWSLIIIGKNYVKDTTMTTISCEVTKLILTVHTLDKCTKFWIASVSLQKERRLLTVCKERCMVAIWIIPRLCCVKDLRAHVTIKTRKSTLYT